MCHHNKTQTRFKQNEFEKKGEDSYSGGSHQLYISGDRTSDDQVLSAHNVLYTHSSRLFGGVLVCGIKLMIITFDPNFLSEIFQYRQHVKAKLGLTLGAGQVGDFSRLWLAFFILCACQFLRMEFF